MKSTELDKLIKLLGMTRSSSEHEAQVAMRLANEHLDKHYGGDWNALLYGKVQIIADPFSAAPTLDQATPPPSSRGAPARPTGYRAPPARPSPPPPPPAQPRSGAYVGQFIYNKFDARCVSCNTMVATGAGWAECVAVPTIGKPKWVTKCDQCHMGKPVRNPKTGKKAPSIDDIINF